MIVTDLIEEKSTVQTGPNLIKAIIFDLDGVIVDTAHFHYLAWKKLAAEVGITLTLEDNERLKGVSRMKSLEIILEIGKVNHLSFAEKQEMAEKKNTWFLELVDQMTPQDIFPGVKELIESFRRNTYYIALASSSKNANRVLELLQIRQLFDVVVDGTMITNSKPDPEIFLLAAKTLQCSPAECLVFEDAEAGVEAAVAAGMRCVGVGSPAQLKKASVIVQRTADFNPEEVNQFN